MMIEVWFQDEMRVGQKNGLVFQWAKRARDRARQRISVTKMLIFLAQSVRAAILECNHHVACRHRSHAEACRRDQQGCCTRRPRADHSRPGGLAHHAQAQSPGKPHLGSAAARMPGTECGGKHLQYLRQTYLSNRVFENYTAILDACQTAWRSLLNELGRIASIATRRDVDGAVLAPRAFLEARDQ